MEEERSPLVRMLLLAVVLVGAGSGAWYVLQKPAPKPPAPAVTPPAAEPVAETTPATPQYPVEAITPPPATVPDAPLPDLFDSDAYVLDALNALFAHPQLAQWLVPEHLVQRFVAFVDALPNRKLSTNLWPAKPVSGRFFVQEAGATSVIGPANNARYAAKALLKYLLLDEERIALDAVPGRMRGVHVTMEANRRYLGMSVEALSEWTVGELVRAGAARIEDGVLVNA